MSETDREDIGLLLHRDENTNVQQDTESTQNDNDNEEAGISLEMRERQGEDDERENENEDEEHSDERSKNTGQSLVFEFCDNVVSLLKPVCLTMCIVIWAVNSLSPFLSTQFQYNALMVYREKSEDDTWLKLGGALLNGLIIVCLVVVMTVILVILYKFRCMKIIWGWLMFSCGLLLLTMGWVWLDLFLAAYNLHLDYITYIMILWNFTVVGVISVFWKAHPVLTQAYLIAVSCMTGWWLTRLPEWTSWAILGLVALYDIIAVLLPKGPLRILVETAQERQEPIPGLIYSSKKFKLGLGDFVFYSVLVGRAALYGFTTLAACFISILMGLCATLFLLGIFRKALPALPISIFFGIIFYFITRYAILPYVVMFGEKGVVA
eukprot:gb/GECH01011947.1/.p1 GENE.gb/GECH01011947.1/~~gb/GECH01011947.1/.p1  ORF type:complete len:379 (+),score=58.02 gb/GECH01011947.1/:1-1137(+)